MNIRRIGSLLLLGALGLLFVQVAWVVWAGDTPPPLLPPANEVLPGDAPFTFAVVGDNRGNQSVFEDILARIKEDRPAFIIHTGDLVKRCTRRQFDWLLHELPEEKLGVPFCAVPGNHDIVETAPTREERLALYSRAFGPPHYWFAYGDVLFVAMDNAMQICEPDELNWLDKTLAKLREQYAACFVVMHVPPRDPRPGGRPSLSAGGPELDALLKKWHVTAVFAGHIHSYLEDNVQGIPVHITGGGGAELDPPPEGYHYLLCRFSEDGKLTVEKRGVPSCLDTDYPEYTLRTRLGGGEVLLVSAAFLMGGIALTWRDARGRAQGEPPQPA